MITYTVTVVSQSLLDQLNDGPCLVDYGDKTYTGFSEVEYGMFAGAYQGFAEGEEVIFFGDELSAIVPE